MGPAAAVAIALIVATWYVLLVVATSHQDSPAAGREAFLQYLRALVLWTGGTLVAWLVATVPGAGPVAALLGGLAVLAGAWMFARAYLTRPLPRLAYGALLAGPVALSAAHCVAALEAAVNSEGLLGATWPVLLAMVSGLSLVGLAAWLWVHAWQVGPAGPRWHRGVLLLGLVALVMTFALYLAAPVATYWLELAQMVMAVAIAALVSARRHLPPLTLPQRHSTGYALLVLLSTFLLAILAYGGQAVSGPATPLLILTAGLMLSGLVLAFPEVADSLSLWVERRILRAEYRARRMVEEVAEVAPAVLDLEPLVSMILERTLQTLDIRWGLFALWDRTTHELGVVTARGLPDEAANARWPADHALAQWLLTWTDAGGAPPAHLTEEPSLPEASWLVAVRLHEEPVGVFVYGPRSSGEPLTPTQQAILDLLANETAAAVANARLFNQVARARREWVQTFDALSDGVFLHDREGRVLRANRALARLVERSFDQIIGRPWFELIPAGPVPRLACNSEPGQARHTAEYDLAYRDQRTLHVTVSPVMEGDEFCVHVVRDVTDERAMQRQLAQAEKLAAIGEMLSGIAHELNNPLTTIIGFSELLQDASVPESVRADLQRIFRQAKHSARIVQGLLAFARQSRLQMSEVDVNALLEQTLDLMQPQLETHNIEARLELDPQLPHALADPGQLQQVFVNLITNAQQAMSAAHGEGTLTIRSQALPTCLRISVRDDGPGIPRDLLQRVFDPFFTTKEVGEGTGLGLSICYGIVREHGGRIWAESEPGQGASFVVELPIRHAAASEAESAPPVPLSSRRILIVESNEETAALFRRVLDLSGHQVRLVRDVPQALEALAEAVAGEQTPDLIVAGLDPEGRGLYEHVRRELPRLGPRWLFITDVKLSPEQERFLQEGRLSYLSRPFGTREVLESVTRALL